jgi:hypothetical protein
MRTIPGSKRNHYMARLSIFLVTMALIAGMVGCGSTTPVKYGLNMAVAPSGSGTATDLTNASPYTAGTSVSIKAVAAVGYQFVNWTALVGTFADANAAQTTFTMPAHDATVTANFALKPAEIRDWYDLDAIRDNLDGSYILMNNLDSTTAGYEELASPTANGGKGWEPIGSLSVDPINHFTIDPVDPFTGSLDGQGYEIRDLFIGRSDEDGVGFFGCVGAGGVVDNLGMMNVAVVGRLYVGGLVGCAFGGGTVSNSHSTGSVTGTGTSWAWVGGLVGSNGWEGTVNNCYSTASVTSRGEYIGCLVGGSWGTVDSSHSTGNVVGGGSVGGLMGANWGTVSDSYSMGAVSGTGRVGGLVGWQHNGSTSNSYSTGNVTGVSSVGGLVGENCNGALSNSYYSYNDVLINGRNIITIGALFNEDFDQWLANDKFLDVNERLLKENGYYIINTVSDFKHLLAFGQNPSLKFRLKNDLDLAGEPNFYIPYLAGEFDGNGRKIANLRFSSDFSAQVGLFGYLASGGTVTGLSAENVNVTGAGIVGGLVGENDGTVSNSYATGSVAGYQSVGGLVGWMGWHRGTVSNSHYNYGEVLINDRHVITIGALFNEDFDQWLANDRFLNINERLAQEDGYYIIDDVSEFKQLLAFGQNDTLKFRLTNNLDLSSEPNFYIPYLAGEFDGNGHKISNLTLNFNSVAQVGLFGYLASGGKVSEVGAENVNITVTGGWQVGGLVGGSVGIVSDSYSTGSVTGTCDIGGLVGENWASVSNSYSSTSVTGGWGVGGLLGWNAEGTVRNSYSTGKVSDHDNSAGALVGWGDSAAVRNSFWDTQTSGQLTSAGGTGKTTAEMKSIATFSGTGWNIVAVVNPGARDPSYVWNIVDGQTYPFLSWQP